MKPDKPKLGAKNPALTPKTNADKASAQLLSALLSWVPKKEEPETEPSEEEMVFYHLASAVDQEQVKEISAVLYHGKTVDAKSFLLYITSDGGSIDCGLAIYDMLRATSLRVTTVMAGACDSIASFIFLGGDRRLVSPHASALVHLPYITVHESISLDVSELKYWTADLENNFRRLKKIIRGQTNLSLKKFLAFCKEKRRLTATELVRYGFAHKIVKPSKSKNKRP